MKKLSGLFFMLLLISVFFLKNQPFLNVICAFEGDLSTEYQKESSEKKLIFKTQGADYLHIYRWDFGESDIDLDSSQLPFSRAEKGIFDEEDCILIIPVFSRKEIVLNQDEIDELALGGDFAYALKGANIRVPEYGFFTVKADTQRLSKEKSRRIGVATATFPTYLYNGNLSSLHPKAGKKLYQIPVEKMAIYTATRKVVRNEWAPGSSWAYSSGGEQPYSCGGHNTYLKGGQPADYLRWRIFLKFDLSSIPENALISDAYIFVRDMREFGWAAEKSPSGTPLVKTVAIASSEPTSFNSIDAFPLSKEGKSYDLTMPTVDPMGIPGKSDIKNQKVCAIGLKEDVKAWVSGAVKNNGLVLNALPLSSVNPSYPGHNLGDPMKKCYFDDIYEDNTFLVVELDDPPKPVEIIAIDSTWPDTINITWQESIDKNYYCYKVFRSTVPGVDITSSLVHTTGVKKTVQFTDKQSISPDTTYYYRVAVYNAARLYALSEEKSIRTPKFPNPVLLSYAGNGMQHIDLEWTKNTDSDFLKNVIYMNQGHQVDINCMMMAEFTDPEINSFRVENLNSGSIHYFAIFTYNQAGIYISSNVIRGDTDPYYPPVAPVLSAQTQPLKVIISWDPTSHELFGSYQIYRSSYPFVTNFDELRFFSGNIHDNTFTDTVETGDMTYYYVMYVYDLTTNDPNYSVSNTIEATPPSAKSNLIPARLEHKFRYWP